ncbi:hypothetical protein BDZ85DRAFT_254612 [Elsinoe ampelina]|uniref:Uncharacterized protein n=1 Tax=Elsinoe ampelina TaxID=302913 RepID=A0A6A6GPF9_9PEZI|nr:hypothetical protein BDZ85DRAFT_254612 [Elsinoe ampelina]
MTWARRCEEAFPEKDFVITAKHGYEIEYKYLWTCSGRQKSSVTWEENDDGSWIHHVDGGCGGEVKAHSKKIDTNTDRCGKCNGHLVQVKPIPSACTNTEWHTYQKNNFRAAKNYLEKQGPTDIGMVSEQLGRWYQGYGSPNDSSEAGGTSMKDFIAPPDEMDHIIRSGPYTFNTLRSDTEDSEEPLEYDSDHDSEDSQETDEEDDEYDLDL